MSDHRIEVVRRHSLPGPRYASYPPAAAFESSFPADGLTERLRIASLLDEPLALDLHIPFCAQRSALCGCAAIEPPKQPEMLQAYLAAISVEMALVAEALDGRRTVDRLVLGGGSPTLLSDADLRWLWNELTRHFDVDRQGELSVEIDLGTTTEHQLELLRTMGFSHIRAGVVELDPVVQQQIGRVQPPTLVRRQLEQASALGYRTIEVELLYGLPGQSAPTLDRTLQQVIEMRPDRVSIQNFAFWPDRFANQRRIDPATVPRLDQRLELRLLAHDHLVAGGYRPVGQDAYALPGDELVRALQAGTLRRDFMGLTCRPAWDLIGIGLSALGDVQGAFVQNTHRMGVYLRTLVEGRLPVARGYYKNSDDDLRGEIIEKLLCLMQVDLGQVATDHGRAWDELEPELLALERFEADGLVRLQGPGVQITDLGRFVARDIARVFDGRSGQAARPDAVAQLLRP